MTTSPARIATYSCRHLGYGAGELLRKHSSGINQRVIDGHVAHTLTMQSILAAGVDCIVDGGDTFHVSRPVPRDITHALRTDDLRLDMATVPPLYANSGNHDRDHGFGVSASASIHRPALGAHAVFPRSPDGRGPVPGYYEIHEPIDGLRLHLVSHYGLDRAGTGDDQVNPAPQSTSGTDLFFTHGIYVGDPRLRTAAEQHGAERLIPGEWVERFTDGVLLSDFHTCSQIPDHQANVWYTGSALRRGFSDADGPRGWVLTEIDDNGVARMTLQPIWQRPQQDLGPVNADGRTVAEVDEEVRALLAGRTWWDTESEQLTGDGGFLLRVQIAGTTPPQRTALNAMLREWRRAADGALQVLVAYPDPRQVAAERALPVGRSITHRVKDYAGELTARKASGRVGKALASAPRQVREPALAQAIDMLALHHDGAA